MPCDILEEHLINTYLSNLDSSGSLGTIRCYLKIPEMCSGFEISYLKCSSGDRFSEYSGLGLGFLKFKLRVWFLCPG
jgi:hypothetical protein